MPEMRLPDRPILLMALFLASFASRAETDLPVYGDVLLNGFEDRYWGSHTLTNPSPVHSGAYSISVAPEKTWEGLYLHHADFDSTPYVSLSFWVNGGPAGGQRLQVQGLLGKANPPADVYYRFTLAPDAWEQITIPLAALGVDQKTNVSGFWIQMTPGGRTNGFYVDDIQINANPAAAVISPRTNGVAVALPAHEAGSGWSAAAWCIAGALVLISALLAWLIVMLRRSGLGASRALVLMPGAAVPQIGLPAGQPSDAAGGEQGALDGLGDPRVQTPRETMAAELAEFAKQSLVQGLYTQRAKLLETQQRAHAELAELEARLASLHLPLQERIRAYETRIAELEKQLETRDEAMRNMIHTSLLLVRERLEEEKAGTPGPSRFN